MADITKLLIYGALGYGAYKVLGPKNHFANVPMVKAGEKGSVIVPPGKTDYVMMYAAQKLYQMKLYGVLVETQQASNPPITRGKASDLFYWWWDEWKKVLNWTDSSWAGVTAAPGGGYWRTGPLTGAAYDMAVSDAKHFWDSVPTRLVLGNMSQVLSDADAATFYYAIGRTAIALDVTNSTPHYEGEIWGDMVTNAKALPKHVVAAIVKTAGWGFEAIWDGFPGWAKLAAVGGLAYMVIK